PHPLPTRRSSDLAPYDYGVGLLTVREILNDFPVRNVARCLENPFRVVAHRSYVGGCSSNKMFNASDQGIIRPHRIDDPLRALVQARQLVNHVDDTLVPVPLVLRVRDGVVRTREFRYPGAEAWDSSDGIGLELRRVDRDALGVERMINQVG